MSPLGIFIGHYYTEEEYLSRRDHDSITTQSIAIIQK